MINADANYLAGIKTFTTGLKHQFIIIPYLYSGVT